MKVVAWILKTEPDIYGWNELEEEGSGIWDGIRNYVARNYMKEMQIGDLALIYHSGKERAIVGTAKITKAAFQDPTDASGKFVAVKIVPVQKLAVPITLSHIKEIYEMKNSLLLKQSRLSVIPINESELEALMNGISYNNGQE